MFDIGEIYKFCNNYSCMYLYPGELFSSIESYKNVDIARAENRSKRTSEYYGFIFTVVDKKECDGYCVIQMINNGKMYTFFHEIKIDDRHLIHIQNLKDL